MYSSQPVLIVPRRVLTVYSALSTISLLVVCFLFRVRSVREAGNKKGLSERGKVNLGPYGSEGFSVSPWLTCQVWQFDLLLNSQRLLDRVEMISTGTQHRF